MTDQVIETIETEVGGYKFTARARAKRRDQNDLNVAMAKSAGIEDGKLIRTSPLEIYPWLVSRFVVGWSGGSQTHGKDILNVLYDQDATPGEDLILVLGAWIFNHVEGLMAKPGDELKKNGSNS